MKYFELFGLTPSYVIDPKSLKKKYYALSRDMHPDKYATAESEVIAQAEQDYSEINKAYEILSDDTKRLQYLMESSGLITEDSNYQLPQDFLIEMLELNELKIEDHEAAASQIKELSQNLDEQLLALLQEVDFSSLTEPQTEQLLEIYYKLKYVQRLL